MSAKSFKPQAKLIIDGEEHRMMMGFGEVQEFERVWGGSFWSAFNRPDGMWPVDAVIKLVAIAVRWKLGSKATEKWVSRCFDENPESYFEAMKAISELIVQFIPKSMRPDDPEKESEPEERPLDE